MASNGPLVTRKGMLTHRGRVRERNEDALGGPPPTLDPQVLARKGELYVVADGMGGHQGGQRASQLAVQTVLDEYYKDSSSDVPQSLKRAVEVANRRVHDEAKTNPAYKGMGTTLVAAVLRGNDLFVANVGDSRLYLMRGPSIEQLTVDHSRVAQMVRSGTITEEEARTHPLRSSITRALGTDADVEVDQFHHKIQAGDRILMCTDGLTNEVRMEELHSITSRHPPRTAVSNLIALANERRGADNISAIVLDVGRTAGGPAAAPIGPSQGLPLPALAAAAVLLVAVGVVVGVTRPWKTPTPTPEITTLVDTPTLPSSPAPVAPTQEEVATVPTSEASTPLPPTATPMAAATATLLPGEPMVGIIATYTPTPKPPLAPTATPVPPTPAPKSYPAPTLQQPQNGHRAKLSAVVLQWNWEGELGADEHFDVRIWEDAGSTIPVHTAWSDERSFRLDLSGSGFPEEFYWSVRVIQVRYDGDTEVFDGELWPDSERWSIEWAGPPPKPTNTPEPTHTPEAGPP